VAGHLNDLPVLYSFCNSFLIRDVRREFGINKCAFVLYILPAILSRKVRDFFLSGER